MWNISITAVVVAAIAGFVVGGLWYGPLFGKMWQAETGVTDEKAKAGNLPMVFGTVFLLNLFSAYILGHVLATYGHPAVATSMMISGGIGIGFVATSIGVNYLFSQKSLRLFIIDASYWALIYTVMGGIFGAFR